MYIRKVATAQAEAIMRASYRMIRIFIVNSPCRQIHDTSALGDVQPLLVMERAEVAALQSPEQQKLYSGKE